MIVKKTASFNDIYEFVEAELGCREYSNIVEIGAHVGRDTARLQEYRGKDGLMFVFEPDPRNVPVLKEKIAGFGNGISLIEKAVGIQRGGSTFFLSSGKPPYEDDTFNEVKNHTASSSLKAPAGHLSRFPWVTFNDMAYVEVTTLDTHFENGPEKIDLIWADIQGAELDMILGGQKALAKTRFLYMEFNDNEMYVGQKGLDTLLVNLPGSWGGVKIFGDEILLQNRTFGDDWICETLLADRGKLVPASPS